jgi:multiple sugar transport system substrate-binding protein
VAVPAPSGPKALGYMTVLVGLAVPKRAKHQAGAERLIDWLTRPTQQAVASSSLGFFPVVHGVAVAGSQAAETRVDDLYRASTKGVESGPPTGLGSKTVAFTEIYQDTFSRIVLDNQDIGTEPKRISIAELTERGQWNTLTHPQATGDPVDLRSLSCDG